jgi:hypothetical protein
MPAVPALADAPVPLMCCPHCLQLLVTFLLCNSAVNTALPIFVDAVRAPCVSTCALIGWAQHGMSAPAQRTHAQCRGVK